MDAWDQFLARQERELGRGTVRKWLRPIRVVHFDACNLYLEAQDSFQALWFEEHIRKKVLAELVNNSGRKIKVHVTVAHQDDPPPKPKANKAPEEKPEAFKLVFDDLDEAATFDALVPFEGNELATKVFGGLAGSLELGSFNPIYVCGPEGSGKSHFLQATARSLRSKGLRVIHARGQTFTEHVVSAIRAGEMQLFRSHYRNVDALLIDDVQIFSRKNATQEELFHTFNTLHTAGKQLIFAANCTPGELRGVEPRLVSRFEWGIVIPLEPPSPATLRQITLRKAKAMKFPLSPDVATFLIDTFKASPARAMRALEALALRAHLEDAAISEANPLRLPIAKSYLADLLEEERQAQITPNKIIHAVARHYGIQENDILGKSQKKECSLPRQIAMYLCRRHLSLPFVRIGEEFKRDHSTVMTSVKRVEQELKQHTSEQAAAVNAIVKTF